MSSFSTTQQTVSSRVSVLKLKAKANENKMGELYLFTKKEKNIIDLSVLFELEVSAA